MFRKFTDAYLNAILRIPEFPPEWPKLFRFCLIGIVMTIKFILGLSLYIVLIFSGMVGIAFGMLYSCILLGKFVIFYDCFGFKCNESLSTDPTLNFFLTGGTVLTGALVSAILLLFGKLIFEGIGYLVEFYKKEFK
jgi:hypothetical protein